MGDGDGCRENGKAHFTDPASVADRPVDDSPGDALAACVVGDHVSPERTLRTAAVGGDDDIAWLGEFGANVQKQVVAGVVVAGHGLTAGLAARPDRAHGRRQQATPPGNRAKPLMQVRHRIAAGAGDYGRVDPRDPRVGHRPRLVHVRSSGYWQSADNGPIDRCRLSILVFQQDTYLWSDRSSLPHRPFRCGPPGVRWLSHLVEDVG